jgi:CheY-like chemotaxis protein
VLVVDDNATCREVLAETLHSFGLDVHTAASGEQALETLHGAAPQHPFQLVLMDWRMPGLDGLETSSRMRRDPALAAIPIVLVTAFGRDYDKGVFEGIGIDGFLHKPIQQSVLFDTLMQVFGQVGAGAGHGAKLVSEATLRDTQALSGARVLLAEDNVINRELALNLLEEVGIEADVACNGREAVEAVQARDYDAVLLDMQMPELDGYGATRRIRRDPRFQGLPIIAMTAHAMEGDRERCIRAGMNDYVSKPIDPARLFASLSRWIKPRSGRVGPMRPTRGPSEGAGSGAEDIVALQGRLPGFHVEEALHRLRGNEVLYRKLLADFARSAEDAVAQIRAALGQGDLEAAHQIIHTLKGVAGNLSAMDVAAPVRELEAAVKARLAGEPASADREVALERLGQALKAAVGSIRALETAAAGAGDTPAPGRPRLAGEQARQLAARLREAAELGDVTALEGLAAELRTQPDVAGAYAQEIEDLAEAFDFEALLRLAEELEGKDP